MTRKSPCALGLALLLTGVISVPSDIYAQAQAAPQRAGEVSRVIPAVSITRGVKSITASLKSVVDWQDLLNTQADGRARVSLDDGSVLNVGSQSSMRVVKHDAGAQQTELEMTYGKLRSQAQKIAKPDGKFEVHTPAGVAGVVGTDFYVGYENNTMNVVAFEGQVKVCNLAGACTLVKAGQMTSVRSGDNSGPMAPQQATLDVLTEAVNATNVGGPGGLHGTQVVGHHAAVNGWAIAIGVAVVGAAIGVPLATHSTTPPPVVPPPNQCPNPNNPRCTGGG